jgi:hypothetical protein
VQPINEYVPGFQSSGDYYRTRMTANDGATDQQSFNNMQLLQMDCISTSLMYHRLRIRVWLFKIIEFSQNVI